MISIVIPSYNVEPYITECLDSIAGQAFTDFEALVVDDGSTDKTPAIVKEFAKQDARFRLIAGTHSNAGDARNLGMREAKGDYLLFFDSDDRMLPTMLSSLSAYAQEFEADVVVCDAQEFNHDSQQITAYHVDPFNLEANTVFSGEDVADRLFQTFVGWPWNKLFRTDFIRENELSFQSLESTNDAYFTFIAIALAKQMVYIDKPLLQHRKRSGSIEKSRNSYPHNAKIAADAIEQKFSEMENGQLFMDSFHSWKLYHLRWNWVSLTKEESQREAFNDYLSVVKSVGPQDDNETAQAPDKTITRDVNSSNGLEFPYAKTVIALEESERCIGDLQGKLDGCRRQIDELSNRIEQLSTRNISLMQQNAERAQHEADLSAQLDSARDWAQELEHSTTFKVGHVITAVPCKIKDKLS